MVARNTRYNVVSVPEMPKLRTNLNDSSQDLLPWADPYIARLVRRLQAEIRRERAEKARLEQMQNHLANELPAPYSDGELEFTQPDEPRWPLLEDDTL